MQPANLAQSGGGNLTYDCKYAVIRSSVELEKEKEIYIYIKYRLPQHFASDMGGLMHFEMIYRSIFICCSHNISGGPPVSHRLSSLLGMSEIHFAISCPHVAKVCESGFYGDGRGGGGLGRRAGKRRGGGPAE